MNTNTLLLLAGIGLTVYLIYQNHQQALLNYSAAPGPAQDVMPMTTYQQNSISAAAIAQSSLGLNAADGSTP